AAITLVQERGAIVAVKPEEAERQTIASSEAGYMPNDLVFDANRGFYFTHFRGTSTHPKGRRLLRLARFEDDHPSASTPRNGEWHRAQSQREEVMDHRIRKESSEN